MNPHQHPMHSWIEGEDQHGVFRGSVSDQSPAPQLPSQRPTNASEPLPIPIQQQRYLIYQSSAPVLHASSTHRHVSHHGHHPLHQPHFIHPQHPQHPQQQQFHQHQQLQQQQHHTDQQQHNLVLHPNDPFLQQVQQQHQSTQEHYRHPQDVQQLRHWLLQHSPQEHPPRHVHGAVRPIERADQGLLQYHHQDQGQYPQQQRLHASDHDAAKEYNQEGNMQNVLSRAHNVHPSFVLPTLSTSPSFSHPEGPTSLPRSLFAPLIPVFVPDASSPSSLTYRRIRSRTLSSIPTSSLPSTSSFYHPQTVTAAPALAALPAFSGDAHSSAQYYPHHTPDPDSIPRRKRGRGSHPAGFGMGGSSSINSLDIAWTTTAGHSQSHPIDIRSMTALPSSLPNLSPLVDWISEDSGGGNQSQYQPQLQQPTLEEQPPLHYKQQPPRHDPSHGALSAPRHDNMSPILIPKTYAPNKRPFVLSPPATRTTFSAEDRSWQRPHPNLSVLQEHQRQQKHELALHQLQGSRQHEGQQEHDRSSARERLSDNNVRTQPAPSPVSRIPPPTPMPRSTTTTTSTSTTHSIPMPHFRAQLMQQRTGDASYMRRFYAATPASSLPSLNPTSLDPSTSVPSHPSSRKAAAVRQRPSNEHMASENATRAGSGASQDVPGAIGIQLGRLLISTKQHVRGLLDSLILSDSRDVDPNLERVLLELLNGMLRSHCAFATRDNISSQEQPLNFRPTMLRSLAHLRELLSTTTTTTTAAAAVGNSPSSSTSNPSRSSGVQARLEGQHLTATRQRSSPLPPSRLSKSTLFPEGVDMEDEDMDTDLETAQFQSGSTVPSSTTTSELPGLDDERATEMYHSTVEFLALMTAFVSVVCWLLQTLRDNPQGLSGRTDASTSESSFREHGLGRRDEKAGGRGGGINMTNETSRSQDNTLRAFLDLFDDRDNVLKPISDALTRDEHHHSRKNDEDIGQDPMAQVGLFAWHFYMFASDPEGPLIRDGQAISAKTLHTIHLDVILNELYTTHVLSMTVKEHQKDHGQFYTPPGVVDFMWKRTIKGYGNLLDRFVESLTSGHDNTQQQQQQHQGLSISLIPIALDPCLGVSTFLSCYVRLLIQEAQLVHGDIIWNSERAARRLLGQICDHVWGIELDGFAFWMARCGILAALMPLVQRVQELALASELSYGNQYMATTRTTISPLKLPPLHLFRNDTLQLTLPDGNTPEAIWERDCIMQLRNPARLQFDFIVTNPPYMIRKTGTFSAPDPQVYDWNILGSSFATNAGVASSSSTSSGLPRGSKSKLTKKKNPDYQGQVVSMEEGSVSAVDTCDEGANESESEVATPDSSVSAGSAASMSLRPERSSPSPQPSRPGAKGMMQAYGYFIWFAAQRIKPYTGVACTITASQWLTLEFAAKLRAWLFENCLLDEFFQFEPFKVFSKVQTDSLIFKIRALDPSSTDPSSREHALQDHSTVFLRHTDHHKSLTGILQDYMDYPIANSQCVGNDLSIMASSKSRQELSAAILAPPPSLAPSAAGSAASTSSTTSATTTTWTYSFAPMMPSSGLTTYLLTLAQDLGGICSAGTKKVNRLSAAEPLLWHRGPNTNPVYGLVVRMEYARVNFGEIMTDRWFRPALYWNGKNSPEESAPGASIHKEGLFWQGRDRLRLSKKEGSPAESYLVPTPDPQRLYALCMMDKESVKVLRQQVEQAGLVGVEEEEGDFEWEAARSG
ncbi:hypothetical protein EDD21DRAFT_409084 [Dissophora ornata]|nr:hypothetical protein EDD21DRAFT_409084 [Dissophora ornata]